MLIWYNGNESDVQNHSIRTGKAADKFLGSAQEPKCTAAHHQDKNVLPSPFPRSRNCFLVIQILPFQMQPYVILVFFFPNYEWHPTHTQKKDYSRLVRMLTAYVSDLLDSVVMQNKDVFSVKTHEQIVPTDIKASGWAKTSRQYGMLRCRLDCEVCWLLWNSHCTTVFHGDLTNKMPRANCSCHKNSKVTQDIQSSLLQRNSTNNTNTQVSHVYTEDPATLLTPVPTSY